MQAVIRGRSRGTRGTTSLTEIKRADNIINQVAFQLGVPRRFAALAET